MLGDLVVPWSDQPINFKKGDSVVLKSGGPKMVVEDIAQDLEVSLSFPLGGFTPLQSDTMLRCCLFLHTTPMAVALAWLLRRSPNILLIPGILLIEHLRENAAGAGLQFSDEVLDELNQIGG